MTTDWKWIRIPAQVHTRLESVKERMQADRALISQARPAVNYGEVIEHLLNDHARAWGEERNRGVDMDSGGPGRLAGDAGSGHVDGVDTAGGT